MAFHAAVVQFNPIRKDIIKNIRTIKSLLSGIKADLIVLPELANSGYLFESMDAIKPFTEESHGRGDFLQALIEIAKDSRGLIITGYAELDNDRVYNSACALTGSGVIGNYRKTHLYAGEKNIFSPGNTGFKVIQWQDYKIGIMICFDWIFPEAARTLALSGAQIIAHPANLVMPFCQDAMVTRSIENRVFTITANRIGQEKLGNKLLKFTGKSQITNPDGDVLYRGPVDIPTVHLMRFDPREANNKLINDQNHLWADRRPQLYGL